MRITKLGEEILRQVAVPVKEEEINDEFRSLIAEMFETMDAANGVGLAAPQVNINKRFFVLMADDDVRRVFINPQIISTSGDLVDYEEGCLSIPKIYEVIKRPSKVTVQALDENGKKFTIEAEGFLARIIQHEYDHLEGIVFIDKGDPDFAKQTEEIMQKRSKRYLEKIKEKEAKARKIAAKKAAKENKHNQETE
ncbi:MAG: peptide deformylase [Treponema sp.]|uniref:peptide deformylase n=1 Tax=Treponema sp. TaxID=166 RepID=UPI00298E3BE9|nr:peptide deformylase [Treponema sp.]MBR5933791.1 peptide deformylase [Treponema sp.]